MGRHYWKILLVVIISGLLAGACLVRTTPGHSQHGVHQGKHKKAKPAKHKKQKDHGKHKGHDD